MPIAYSDDVASIMRERFAQERAAEDHPVDHGHCFDNAPWAAFFVLPHTPSLTWVAPSTKKACCECKATCRRQVTAFRGRVSNP
jgi:hypothetical protein